MAKGLFFCFLYICASFKWHSPSGFLLYQIAFSQHLIASSRQVCSLLAISTQHLPKQLYIIPLPLSSARLIPSMKSFSAFSNCLRLKQHRPRQQWRRQEFEICMDEALEMALVKISTASWKSQIELARSTIFLPSLRYAFTYLTSSWISLSATFYFFLPYIDYRIYQHSICIMANDVHSHNLLTNNNIQGMNLIRSTARFAINRLVMTPAANFAGDSWKDRDEAAEKVYINRKERDTLKKLLNQIEEEELDRQSDSQRFESELVQIMDRYKIDNKSLQAEIAHLHRELRE